MKFEELKIGDKIRVYGYESKLVDYDGEYLYFKHEWSPAVFQIKKDDVKRYLMRGDTNET